ncbi:MAG: histidinol dehydrogenase, partial [bacterium]
PAKIETVPGIPCWRKSVPIQRVGLYIPGGSAPLLSTVLMLGIPARIAGCREIILCTPPNQNGAIHPAVLYTANILGISKIFKIGGAHAIAAMAYGTEFVPKVDKIFGPGNQFVTAAKQLVSKEGIAIDLPAGPTELAVIADASCYPAFVAADLLSQAEHGPDSQVVLISDNEKMIDDIHDEIISQLERLPRKEIATQAIQKSKSVLIENLETAIAFANTYAPEHLILAVENAELLAEKVINAGSVFLGHFAPESAGDYASGTNHTLPTNGYARAYSGVSVESFVKKITFQQLSQAGLRNICMAVQTMAEAEGLHGHKNAVAVRLNEME